MHRSRKFPDDPYRSDSDSEVKLLREENQSLKMRIKLLNFLQAKKKLIVDILFWLSLATIIYFFIRFFNGAINHDMNTLYYFEPLAAGFAGIVTVFIKCIVIKLDDGENTQPYN